MTKSVRPIRRCWKKHSLTQAEIEVALKYTQVFEASPLSEPTITPTIQATAEQKAEIKKTQLKEKKRGKERLSTIGEQKKKSRGDASQ